MKMLNLVQWKTPLRTIAAAGLFFMLAPSRLVEASIGEEFDVCAKELQQAGLSADEASAACSEALHPEDLSLCVLSMNVEVDVTAQQGLENCFRDRRPVELATCVIDIDEAVEVEDVGNIVQNCRKSLQPLRYSECVIGLTAGNEIAVSRAVDDCIAADDSPKAPIEQ